jgi:hypothetical protein
MAADNFAVEINLIAQRMLKSLMRHRERYLRAWIASTGLRPEECMLIEEVLPVSADGIIRTHVYVVPKREGALKYYALDLHRDQWSDK